MAPPGDKIVQCVGFFNFSVLFKENPKMIRQNKHFLTTWKQLRGKYIHFGQKESFHLYVLSLNIEIEKSSQKKDIEVAEISWFSMEIF